MRENLARFIVERLLDLDPTLPDTEGSVVYTKVVNPLLARLGTDPMSVDIEAFIISRLQAEFPFVDYTSPGSVLRDLVVSPLVLLLDPLKSEIQFAKNQNTLANSAGMTEAEMDALLSNVFATRNTGSYALVTVRVFFSNPRTFSVDQSIVFSTATGIGFVPQTVTNYLPSNFVRSGNLFYVDIPLRSIYQADLANVAANTIKFVNALDGVVRLTNLTAASGGVTKESNADFLTRAGRSLSERSLNTKRGIETNLRNSFSDIVSVDIVGYGDPGMQRDILQGEVVVPPGPGPLVATTNKFKTLPVLDGGDFPLSNKVSVKKSAQVTAHAKIGNFIRLSDGDGNFDDPVLSRPRRIVMVEEDTNVLAANQFLILTLSDFEVYKAGANPLTLDTEPAYLGYNKYSRQGTDYQLFALDNGTPYVRGAPLPFDELVPLVLTGAGAPDTVIPGRDFLVLQTPTDANEKFIRCHPLHARVAGGVTLSRLDSFMTAKNRIPYQGPASFTYRPGPDVTTEVDGVQVISFGGPALSKNVQNGRYDGKTKELWGRSAGVRLEKPGNNPNPYDTCKVLIDPLNGTWTSKGVSAGQYISLARFSDQIGNPAANYNGGLTNAATQLAWHAWGRIVSISQNGLELTVAGLDWSQDPEANQADWRLFWTVYVGELETVGPDGNKYVSYADQVFAPAYRIPAAQVHTPMPAPYRNGGYFDGDRDTATATPWTTGNNGYTAVWLRLERPFFDVDPGIGSAPAQKMLTSFVTDLSKTNLAAGRKQVSRVRFNQTFNATAPIFTKVSLPYVEGWWEIRRAAPQNPSLVLAGATPPPSDNQQGAEGYLLPAILGSYNAAANQVLQIFDSASAEQLAEDVAIVVSGIPGSLPLVNLLPAPVTVENNKVHIGGMTDVYVKPSLSSGETSGSLKLTPQHITPAPTDPTADVLFEGTDGALDPNNTSDFISAKLLADLSGLFGINVNNPNTSLDNLVLEILDPPDAALKPKVARMLHNIPGGVRIDGLFSPLLNAVVGLKWRVLRSATMSLEDPIILYQEGGDLITTANNVAVQSPGGFSFSADPTLITLYLSIDEGPDQGEYLITSKALNSIKLNSVMESTGAGLRYRVYAKQLGPVTLPLIRVSNVSLSGDQQGVSVPYRHPVDISASTFSGINDDPVFSTKGLLFSDAGKLYLRDETVLQNPNKNFLDNNIGQYDVVRFESMDEPDKYFSVIRRVPADANPLKAGDLELDRTIASIPTGYLNYTAGHPSVGTATVSFMDKTYVEATPSTVFSFVDTTGTTVKFRPSLAESAPIFRAEQTSTDVVPGTDNQNALKCLSSASINLIGLGVESGDEVRVLTKVLKSAVLVANTNLPLVGKNLVLVVDGVRYSVLFTGGVNTSLAAIATDITSQTGGLVAGKEQILGNQQYRLDLCSRNVVEVTDEGTPGLLVALGLQPENNAIGKEWVVGKVDLNTNQSRITVTTLLDGLTANDTVFIDVYRNGVQRIYPADMVQQTNKMYTASLKLTSYDPFVVDQGLQDRQLVAEGYKSFGYELLVDNPQYSFSVAEKVSIRVTSIMLEETATTVEDAIVLAGTSAVVSYDRASTVADIQSYMLQPDARVVNNNPLVRHFLPAYPLMTIQYRGPVSIADLTTKLSTFLASLYPNRPLEVFDLTSMLERAGATYVVFPQQAAFLTHDASRVIRVVRSEDVLTLDPRYHIMEIVDDLVTITAV